MAAAQGNALGKLGKLLHGNRAVATLVRTYDHRLPAAARLLLNAVQRETLLRPDCAKSGSEGLGVVRWHVVGPLACRW